MKKVQILAAILALTLITGCAGENVETNNSDTTQVVAEIETETEIIESKAVAQFLTEKEMAERNHVEQIYDYDSPYVLAYKNSDGTKTLYVFSSLVENGSITYGELSDGYYNSSGTYVDKMLPEKLSVNAAAILSDSEFSASIFPADDKEYTATRKTAVNAFNQEKDAVVYEDMFGSGVDFYCYLTNYGINSEIIMPEYTGQNTFRLKIQLPDLVPDTGSPDYILFKTALEKGDVKSILYTPMVVDKNGTWCYANSVKLVEKDSATGTYTLEYTIDNGFLSNENTVYPVTLNQSIHLYKAKQPDTSAYSKTGDEAGHYLSPYMLLGDSTLKGEGWTYIRFDALDTFDIDQDKIISTKYCFHNMLDVSEESVVGAYAVTADWCSVNTRWFNRPTYDENPVAKTGVKIKGDYSLDITSLFKVILSNIGIEDSKYSVRNSFFIKSDTANSNLLFSSGDNGLFSPYLEIVLSE